MSHKAFHCSMIALIWIWVFLWMTFVSEVGRYLNPQKSNGWTYTESIQINELQDGLIGEDPLGNIYTRRQT